MKRKVGGRKSVKKSEKRKMEVQCMLIPHAGKEYAGDARKRAFVDGSVGRQVHRILYLAALHNHSKVPNRIYVFDGDSKDKGEIPDNVWNEHSYRWVHPELKEWFPLASITVMVVPMNEDIDQASVFIDRWISSTKNRSIVIGTTDLVHYGSQYGMTDLEYPQQASKQRREEDFVKAIRDSDTQNILNLYNNDRHLACGPIPILLISILSKKNKWKGRIVDYYDSHGIKMPNKIDRYSIDYNQVDMFVSYLSVVYAKSHNISFPDPMDVNIALGNVKTVVSFQAISDAKIGGAVGKMVEGVPTSTFLLPKWCSLRNLNGGVFVGTSINGRTNCSYGRYQSDNVKTAEMILDAANDCPRDAATRWNIPISSVGQSLNEIKSTLDRLKYKVEFLQQNTNEKPWKKMKATEFAFGKNSFTVNNPYGVYLKFKTSLGNLVSATYLPYVWKDSLPTLNASEMLDELSEKAAGKNDKGAWREDPDSEVLIYKTYKYEL